ncbi:MAG: hypothetical protein B6244_10760 [Candidatus Cloacimonetes bacterium 4572_55]|nr:MAG: hypothetical protein B6244_10760 [Candidatus Cloacimonetes bacterium 4572_55]
MKLIFRILLIIGVVIIGSGLIQRQFSTEIVSLQAEEAHDDHEGHDHGDDDADHEAEGDDHEGHDHGDDGTEPVIPLFTTDQQTKFGIHIERVAKGRIEQEIKLTGEVKINEDRLAHLAPRIAGVVLTARKNLGDTVRKGEVIATFNSRDLADIKSSYLSSKERLDLAKINFQREEEMWSKKIISERDFLESKQELAEFEIEFRAAKRQLHALGFTRNSIESLNHNSDVDLTSYQLTAPFDGVVIKKHIVQGELATEETIVFVIADLSSLWADLIVYPQDLTSVSEGQLVTISALEGTLTATGKIFYLSPVVTAETRTGLARVMLDNSHGRWPAGIFITATIGVDDDHDHDRETLTIDKNAVQNYNGQQVVFIVTNKGYIPQTVRVGRSDSQKITIIDGLTHGQAYVSRGAFELKALLVTQSMDSHAGHGH